MPTVIAPQQNPLHPSVIPRLDKQYSDFYNKHMAAGPMIHQVKWDPACRSAPAVPGGADPLPVAEIKDIALDDFTIRVFYPDAPRGALPVFIWYHGGGMVLGGLGAENAFCTRVCNAARCAVVAVDYRMAPEFKFPVGSNDAYTAFKYVYEHGAELGLDVARFGIGGSSSGGNLAAMVSHRAGLDGIKIDFMVLGVPVCDNTADAASYQSWDENRHCPGLPEGKMMWYREMYLPDRADWSDPTASPLLAPDAWFANSVDRVLVFTAELDLLRSEGDAYAAKLAAHGKTILHRTYPGVPHAVQAMDNVLDTARVWILDMCKYVAAAFGRHPADVKMVDLYPQGEIGVPRIDGGAPWVRLDTPMVLGEAPLYRDEDKTLHYVDCLKEPAELHILQLDAAGEAVGKPRVLELEESVTVACFREAKPGYICAYFAGVAFLDQDTGALEILKEIIPQEDRAIRRFNDGMVDCAGRFWLAEIDRKALSLGMGKLPADYGEPLGRLWRYDPDGSLHLMETGLVCGNGLAWSPDNKTSESIQHAPLTAVYLNDSAYGVIYAYDFDIPTGGISNKRLFVDRRVLGGEPDGMVCDVDGNLWIAMWGSYCVMCFSADGTHVRDVEFTAKNMACTAWGGPDYDTLYIASAMDRTPGARPDDDGGHLFKYRVGVQGLPKYRFKG
ncbi:hypothetical protein Q5752_003985 [Cryptotrichosporon argae]